MTLQDGTEGRDGGMKRQRSITAGRTKDTAGWKGATEERDGKRAGQRGVTEENDGDNRMKRCKKVRGADRSGVTVIGQ